MKRFRQSIVLATFGFAMLGALDAHALEATSFELLPVNATCLPDATGEVTVFHKEDALGVDILHLRVRGLPARTDFAVFLTSADAFAAPPFGSTAYLGDFTTNAKGIGTLKAAAIINEAFLTTRAGDPPVRSRTDLDHLVFWFADPDQVPPCFNFSNPTPFDGDGEAGPAAMSSQGPTGLEEFPQ